MLSCGVAARTTRHRELRVHPSEELPLTILHRADANIAGAATGAMSYAFIAALKKNPQQSYVQLLNSIRDELEGKYDQKPQLSCSHPLDTDILYVSCCCAHVHPTSLTHSSRSCKYSQRRKSYANAPLGVHDSI